MTFTQLKYALPVAFVMALSPAAQADTVTTKTYVQAQELENVNAVNFKVFDTNKDGIFSMSEVGDKLFESFDTNNDDLIDNTEWNTKTVITVIPMEKETFQFVDYDDDGLSEKSSYTYQTFYQASGLIGFDDNQDGLSAADFIETPLLELDDNDNKMIDKEEWGEAYKESRMKHAEQDSYN